MHIPQLSWRRKAQPLIIISCVQILAWPAEYFLALNFLVFCLLKHKGCPKRKENVNVLDWSGQVKTGDVWKVACLQWERWGNEASPARAERGDAAHARFSSVGLGKPQTRGYQGSPAQTFLMCTFPPSSLLEVKQLGALFVPGVNKILKASRKNTVGPVDGGLSASSTSSHW
jgi:hypothetical protein